MKYGHYGFLTYYFSEPSVNLDHSEHMHVKYTSGQLIITFTSTEAFKHAEKTWEKKMILITYIEGCGDWSKGERCYFKVTGLKFNKGGLLCIASGETENPEDIITRGETEWGWWVPRYGGAENHGPSASLSHGGTLQTASPSETGAAPSFTWNPTATASISSSLNPSATSTPGSNNNTTAFSDPRKACKAPIDAKYGLPSACLGEYFDYDLDEAMGSESLSQQFVGFIKEAAPDMELSDQEDVGASPKSKRIIGFVVGWVANKLIDLAPKPVQNFLKPVIAATSIDGTINGDLTWKLPNPASKDPKANQLKDPSTKQVKSPWGDSILIKAFGKQPEGDDEGGDDAGEGGEDSGGGGDNEKRQLNGYLNIFCVGCGVAGTARVAGKASWHPLLGFQTGQITINSDMQFILKVGIDAQVTYKKEFKNQLLDVGLPGLEYGIVRIGPSVSVDSRIELEASAKGKLLAGAEMGLMNAEATIDFVNPSASSQRGFEPYVKPIFEADGELMLSAGLFLPLGLRCGVKVAGFRADIALIDEPSIKGVAQVAASIGLSDSNKFEAGFTETDGCTGISSQLSWRNRVYLDVLSLKDFVIHDTKDMPLARGCISLPGRPDGNPKDPESPADPEDPENPTGPDGGQGGDGGDGSEQEDGSSQGNSGQEDSSDQSEQNGGEEEAIASRIRVRQASPNGSSPSSDSSTGEASDNTSSFQDQGSETLSYDLQSVGNAPYNLSSGYELALMIDPNITTMVLSCGNGNLYAVPIEGEDNPYCNEMWSTKNDVLITDGAQRFMHYYNNTMSALGVSRLRVEDEKTIPDGGVVFAFVPYYYTDDKGEDYYYLAVDPYGQVFYPIVCDYSDGAGSKVFVADDPDKGADMLESKDLMFTVTGGAVSRCYPMALVQGEYVEEDDWMSNGEEESKEEKD